MKKHVRKLALLAVFAMAVSLITPAAQVAEAAAKKTFTYAEQVTGDKVTTLVMDKGEKVDLKFNGVSNWKSYTYKWASSNQKVAVVDSAGVITAIGEGIATIQLTVGDGSEYTSTGVIVYVGKAQEVTIGTAATEEIKSYTIEMGKTAVLKANGLMDNVGDRYTFDWSSTDTSVAKISDEGVITPVAPGLCVIQLTVTKAHSKEVMEATPIALMVTGAGSGAATATATPAPTQAPNATATPTPTAAPTATPTPVPTTAPSATVTPAPTDEYVAYTATLEADNCLLLRFASPVSYGISDIELCQQIVAGTTVVDVKWEILSATLSNNGTELRIVPILPFGDGEQYTVKVGSADSGTDFKVRLGAPTRMTVTYECLGTEGAAYAYDEEVAIDVPVTLTYRLYYGNIDVTETYKNKGYISYDFTASKYEEYASINGEEINFFTANASVIVSAVFTYYDNNGNEKEVKTNVVMKSSKLPSYSIQNRIVNWTVIDTSKSDKIDWENPVYQVISGTETAKLVVMIADSYGNYYVTDERGVDIANKIYSIYDYDALFSQFGYDIEFSAANTDQFIVSGDGSFYPYQAVSNAIALVTLTNSGYNTAASSRTIGVCQLKILAESKLSALSAESTSVTLAAQAIDGYEDRFCETDVEILLKDQYGNAWNGDYNLELSSSVTDVNNALGTSLAPAVLTGTTLHIDAENIKLATNKTTVSFTVTETTLNRKVTITVKLQSPTMSNGQISVTGWDMEVDNATINLGEASDTLTQSAVIEAFKVSSNGVKVGLYTDLYVLESTNYKFTTTNCEAGEVYVLVLGPDGKPVDMAANSNSLGVYIDEANGCIKVNVSALANDGTLSLESLAAGKYTVKATRIVSIGTSSPKTATLTASFTVNDTTKTVTYRTVRSSQTPLTVSGTNDLSGVSEIIESLFIFDLDGSEWTEMTAEMITDVDYIVNGSYIIIKSVEFAVPVDSTSAFTTTYKKTVSNINKSIRTGVTN